MPAKIRPNHEIHLVISLVISSDLKASQEQARVREELSKQNEKGKYAGSRGVFSVAALRLSDWIIGIEILRTTSHQCIDDQTGGKQKNINNCQNKSGDRWTVPSNCSSCSLIIPASQSLPYAIGAYTVFPSNALTVLPDGCCLIALSCVAIRLPLKLFKSPQPD
jgi:hypothetical protein